MFQNLQEKVPIPLFPVAQSLNQGREGKETVINPPPPPSPRLNIDRCIIGSVIKFEIEGIINLDERVYFFNWWLMSKHQDKSRKAIVNQLAVDAHWPFL